tara:strand:+ start:40 stop:411 length:372 start_codon:yes stop_codon:yes gene_type:complete
MNKIFNLKQTIFILLFILTTGFCFSQKTEVKSKKVVIKTSSQCGMCKDKIEGVLNYTKGIVYANLDVPTQRLTVKFKPNKISFVELKNKIADIGYDADDVKAKEEDVKKLPRCCQPGAHFKKN